MLLRERNASWAKRAVDGDNHFGLGSKYQTYIDSEARSPNAQTRSARLLGALIGIGRVKLCQPFVFP